MPIKFHYILKNIGQNKSTFLQNWQPEKTLYSHIKYYSKHICAGHITSTYIEKVYIQALKT